MKIYYQYSSYYKNCIIIVMRASVVRANVGARKSRARKCRRASVAHANVRTRKSHGELLFCITYKNTPPLYFEVIILMILIVPIEDTRTFK
jgi:hypothetical protein